MKSDTPAPYGYCPVCGGLGRSRERRPNGDDRCENGHTYPSSKAVSNTLTPVSGEKSVIEAREELQLRNLLKELVNIFGWADPTPLHAVLHVQNAVGNMQTDVRLSERAAIVAWLREKAQSWGTEGSMGYAADLIERGEHRNKE